MTSQTNSDASTDNETPKSKNNESLKSNNIPQRKRKNAKQMCILEDQLEKVRTWNNNIIKEISHLTGLSYRNIYKWQWDQRKKKDNYISNKIKRNFSVNYARESMPQYNAPAKNITPYETFNNNQNYSIARDNVQYYNKDPQNSFNNDNYRYNDNNTQNNMQCQNNREAYEFTATNNQCGPNYINYSSQIEYHNGHDTLRHENNEVYQVPVRHVFEVKKLIPTNRKMPLNMQNGKVGLLNTVIKEEFIFKKEMNEYIDPVDEIFCEESVNEIPIRNKIIRENSDSLEIINKSNSFDCIFNFGFSELNA